MSVLQIGSFVLFLESACKHYHRMFVFLSLTSLRVNRGQVQIPRLACRKILSSILGGPGKASLEKVIESVSCCLLNLFQLAG